MVPPVARVEPITTARALRGPFDYLRPEGVGVGSMLVVPFGHRDVLGVVVGIAEESEVADERLVEPREVLDAELPVDLVELAGWIAVEYCSTPARGLSLVSPHPGAKARMAWWAEAIGPPDGLTERQTALLASVGTARVAGQDLPALRRLERRGLVRLERRAVRRAPEHAAVGARRAQPDLTADQAAALAEIEAAIAARDPARLLLHGVTGSGKTEVYLQAAAAALAQGRGAIVLVPEIALTPQIVSRFVDRFGDTVAVLHSKLSRGRAPRRVAPAARAARRRSASARARRSSRRSPTSGSSWSTRSTTPPTSTRATRATTPARVAWKRAADHDAVLLVGSATPRPESVRALRRLRLPARRRAVAAGGRDRRHARHRRRRCTRGTVARAGRRAQGDRAAQPPRLVELPGLPRLRPRLELPELRRLARPAPRGRTLACHHCGHRERVPEVCRSAAR